MAYTKRLQAENSEECNKGENVSAHCAQMLAVPETRCQENTETWNVGRVPTKYGKYLGSTDF